MIETRDGNFVAGPMLKEIWEMTRAEWFDRALSS